MPLQAKPAMQVHKQVAEKRAMPVIKFKMLISKK
jgi:hypothetical protein